MNLNIQLQNRIGRVICVIGALSAWTAVILQFILVLQNSTSSVLETIIQFFSYFTILTNMLVALCFTAMAIKLVSDKQTFFTDPRVLAVTAVYIIIVGAVYNFVLRSLWTPTGLQILVDELLHTVIPLLYLTFWFIIANKPSLRWRDVFVWLIFPLGYFMAILMRGALSGFYPYPFVDVIELGWPQVILNAVLLAGVFMVLSVFIVLISRVMKRE